MIHHKTIELGHVCSIITRMQFLLLTQNIPWNIMHIPTHDIEHDHILILEFILLITCAHIKSSK